MSEVNICLQCGTVLKSRHAPCRCDTYASRPVARKRGRQGATEGVISRTLVRARKVHYCASNVAQECQRRIDVGDAYYRVYGRAHAYESAYVLRICAPCDAWHEQHSPARKAKRQQVGERGAGR